ncbi:hypothetical protein RND81_11G006900 [Saponaria officinalis]|uniref:F-box domain-containing protein n=1 Tax=Saponaria officinalis TaxID=3572 RepID=A0AAW1HHY9_SAPOF
MALNFSHRPIFPAHMPEDNRVPGGSQEKDIHDILPDDPFGMDISSTVTAITGWLEDLAVSDYGMYRGDEVGVDKGHCSFFGGLNFWWDTPLDVQPRMGWSKNDYTMFTVDRLDGFATFDRSVDNGGGIHYGRFSTEDVVFGCGDGFVHENKNVLKHDNLGGTMFMDDRFDEFVPRDALGRFVDEDVMFGCGGVDVDVSLDGFGDVSPHMALSFALAYLDIRDLLNVERVCKSLRQNVRNDPLLWKNIQIDHPLNDRITDDGLLHLTSRAQGHLQCLSLVECKVVTDDGLRRVLENNPRLTKVCVSGCIKISTEGVISCLKTFQPGAVSGIKCLRIAGHAVTLEQFEELKSLLGINKHVKPHRPKPHFFNRENIYISCEDDRPIDLEPCPKCEKPKLVYNCTAESCQVVDQATQSCRACAACIPRCEQCGRCIFNLPHVETFCLGFVCTDCSPDNGATSSMRVVSSEIDG